MLHLHSYSVKPFTNHKPFKFFNCAACNIKNILTKKCYETFDLNKNWVKVLFSIRIKIDFCVWGRGIYGIKNFYQSLNRVQSLLVTIYVLLVMPKFRRVWKSKAFPLACWLSSEFRLLLSDLGWGRVWQWHPQHWSCWCKLTDLWLLAPLRSHLRRC